MRHNIFSEVMIVQVLKNVLGLTNELYSQEEWKALSRSEIGMIRILNLNKYKVSNCTNGRTIEAMIASILLGEPLLDKSSNHFTDVNSEIKIADFVHTTVIYIFEIFSLFRRQIFDISDNHKEFTIGVLKEILLPQLTLILNSDIFVQKICNLSVGNEFTPSHGYYDLNTWLPVASPIGYFSGYICEAINEKKSKNQEINFSSLIRKQFREFFLSFNSFKAYQEFKFTVLDKLSFKQIPNFCTLKGHLKSLRKGLIEEAPERKEEINNAINAGFGLIVCGTSLERFKKILIKDFEYTVSQFEECIGYLYILIQDVVKASGFRKNYYSSEILNANYSFLIKNFPHLDKDYFPSQAKISHRIHDFLQLIENTSIIKKYLLPNSTGFMELVAINCLLNNNTEMLNHAFYNEQYEIVSYAEETVQLNLVN